jgi:hypothetical protein
VRSLGAPLHACAGAARRARCAARARPPRAVAGARRPLAPATRRAGGRPGGRGARTHHAPNVPQHCLNAPQTWLHKLPAAEAAPRAAFSEDAIPGFLG